MNETSLKGLFQGMAGSTAEVIQGTVIQESPLKIQALNDDKLIINEAIIFVPRYLTDHEVEVDISIGGEHGGHDGGDGSHEHKKAKMTVYNSLKQGDQLHILAFASGKQYFVLDRVKE